MKSSFYVFILAISSLSALGATTRTLPFPKNGSAMDTIDKNVRGILRLGNQLILTIHNHSYFVVSPFNGIKKFQDQTFGKYSESKRHNFPIGSNKGSWQAAISSKNKLALFDGENLRIAVFGSDKFEYIGAKSIAWDLIRPAADRGGEPTKVETAALRAKFKKNFRSSASLKISGVAPDVGGWLGKKGEYFFLATRIKDFPLITMRCLDGDMFSCQVDRACFMRKNSIKPHQLSGIAVDVKNRELLFADALNHKILRYNFKTCFDSFKVGEIILPKKINEMTGLHLDENRNMWVVVMKPDSYHNASVYQWNSASWSE